MLNRCANSQCSKRFLKLREGKLFLVETGSLIRPPLNKGAGLARNSALRGRKSLRQVERVWLCDECASQWTLAFDRDRGIVLAPLFQPLARILETTGGQSTNLP
jgi:hypothetical protein